MVNRLWELTPVHPLLDEPAIEQVLVQQYVRELLTAAPKAIARAKALIPQVAGRPPAEVRDITSRAIAEQRVSPEGQEGLRAFLEKRKPSWTA